MNYNAFLLDLDKIKLHYNISLITFSIGSLASLKLSYMYQRKGVNLRPLKDINVFKYYSFQ